MDKWCYYCGKTKPPSAYDVDRTPKPLPDVPGFTDWVPDWCSHCNAVSLKSLRARLTSEAVR